jgi:hypothetical protein
LEITYTKKELLCIFLSYHIHFNSQFKKIKMKIKIRWAYPSVLFVILLFLVSCHQSAQSDAPKMEMKEVMLTDQQTPLEHQVSPPPPPPPPPSPDARFVPPAVTELASGEKEEAPPQKIEVTERKIIKTGDVRFKTNDLQKTRQAVVNAVNTYKGYVSEEGQTGNGSSSEMHITVRVPSQYFDSLMTIISSNAEYFDTKNIHTQDVTEEYIDVAARIKTKKTLENQYVQVLKQAKNVKEIMEVERALNEVREQIESAEGRLRYLSSQVSYSTLTLNFYIEVAARSGSPRGFWARMGDGLVGGWQSLLDIIIGFVGAWPVWLVLGVLFLGVRQFLKWRKNEINES